MQSLRTGLLSALIGTPLLADAQASPPQYRIEIPRQSLGAALAVFARETGFQVARYSATGDPMVEVNAVAGTFTAERALELLLAGSGYHYRFVNDHTVAIVRDPPPAPEAQPAVSEPAPPPPPAHEAHRRLGARIAALLGMISIPAFAQTPDASSDSQGANAPQEVIVTAQRRSENLQKTPVAVTAISQAALADLQVNRTEDLTRAVPSLTVQQTTASQSSLEIAMRGGSEQSGGLATSESPVALYVDDVYQSRLSAANLSLGDIERVEVLRGPQGTLYGRNTMTGAIKFITQAPDGVSKAHVQATGGNFDTWSFNGGVGGKIADQIAGTISAVFDQHGGWQYDTTLQKRVGDLRTVGVRGALGLLDTGPFTAVLRASYFHQYDQAQYFTPVDPNPPYEPLVPGFGDSRTPQLTKADENQTSVSLNLDYRIGDLTLHSISAVQSLTDRWQLEFSGGFQAGPASPVVAGFLRSNDTSQHQFTQEFQGTGTALDGRLSYIGGLFWYRETADETLNDTFGPPLFGPTFVTLLPSTLHTVSRSAAAYGQLEWNVTDPLKLIVGVRYTDDKKTFDGTIQNGFGFPPTVAPTNGDISNHVFTPKGSIVYQFTPDVMGYATISRGYRAGGFNALAFGQPSVFGQPYAPEFMTSYEVGLKSTFLDRRLRLNVALYDEKLTDLQQVVILADGTNLTQNAAEAKVKGLEFDGSFSLGAGVSLFANVALTDDSYGRLAPDSAAALAHATRLPLVSHTQWDVGGSWRITPPALGGNTFIVAADYAHKSPMFSQAADTLQGYVDTSDRVNASLALESADRHWQVKAAGTNIFDEKHYVAGYFLIPGLIATRLPAPPRMGTLSVLYKY